MTTQRLHRITELRRKRKAEQAHSEQLSAQADQLILHLRGTRIAASRDNDQLNFTVTVTHELLARKLTGGFLIATLGLTILTLGRIPLTHIPIHWTAATLTAALGAGMCIDALQIRHPTWSLSVPIGDPLVTRLLEHTETIAWLRALTPEPGRYEMITRENRRRIHAITSHPDTQLRRAPSLLSRTITRLRAPRR